MYRLAVCEDEQEQREALCTLCGDVLTAEMTRRHNNSNMLAMGAGIIGKNLALKIVSVWLNTEYEGGRHDRRLKMIDALEQG